MLFLGLALLTMYITKSYYIFNDIEYKDVLDKLIKEEKKRDLDVKLYNQKRIPTKLYNNMFTKPTPWMGYTDDLTKDFIEDEKEDQDEINEIGENTKKLMKQSQTNSNKGEIIKKMIDTNKKEIKKTIETKEQLKTKLVKLLINLEKKEKELKEGIKVLTTDIKDLNDFIGSIDPKTEKDESVLNDYKNMVIFRDDQRKTLAQNKKDYEKTVQDIKDNKKLFEKTERELINEKDASNLLQKKLENQDKKLIDDNKKIKKEIKKNDNKIKAIKTVKSFEL